MFFISFKFSRTGGWWPVDISQFQLERDSRQTAMCEVGAGASLVIQTLLLASPLMADIFTHNSRNDVSETVRQCSIIRSFLNKWTKIFSPKKSKM